LTANPFLGVVLHSIGGLAAGSFYVPYRGVRKWAWESYWLAGGVFSWILAPWALALLVVPNIGAVLREAPASSLAWSYAFGAMWGVGGLTYGLTMRYLGMSLGVAVALGYCAVFGTLMPPIFNGQIVEVVRTLSGITILGGVAVCVAGIAVSGLAGRSKERELTEEQRKATIREFSFVKGLVVATFSGIMSASMSYGFAAGKPIAALAVRHGTPELWQNIPVLVVVLAGGFTTNFLWCLGLNIRNRSLGDYVNGGAPILANYALCALAGTTWYFQFFFYGMGTTKMGQYDFSSWTLHMATIIIFGTLWGIVLREWKGTSRRTHRLIALGLLVLVSSTLIVGYGNYLGASATR